jgi:Flp pilus assembly pilin Flp
VAASGPEGRGERGVTAVEYALLVTLLVLLVAGAAARLHHAVQVRFDRDAGCASTAYRGRGC